MANRQKIAPMGLAGVMAQRGLQTTLTVPGKRFVAGNGGLETAGLLVDAGKKMAEERLETEKQRQAMEAAASLRASRQAMEAAETPEQLREIATTAEKSLPAQFGSENSGKAFWQEHGDKILEANRADTAKIAAMKQADFGRNSLRSMLADNQNLLAETAEPVQAEKLLEMGTGEIERTPFLTPEDKQFYRDGYLKTGILNLALNSPETAEKFSGLCASIGVDFKQHGRIESFRDMGGEFLKISADYGVVLLNDSQAGIVSPSKYSGYITFGLPVLYLGPKGTNAWRVCAEFGAGITACGFPQLDECVRLVSDKDNQRLCASHARAAAEYFSAKQADMLAKAVLDISEEPSGK